MSDVEFNPEERGFEGSTQWDTAKKPALVSLMIKIGLAKDVRGANYVLIGIAVLALVGSIMVFGFTGSENIEGTADPAVSEQVIPGQVPGLYR
ncbi:MAG: hypothetical protein BMS9Abin13_662 [Patescibacteria group bacterium]|nr:MAG: hypothetical protein BMS9Abin13_662 [Patescibacteria group bacterium]